MKNTVVTFLKIAISAGIIAFLAWDAVRNEKSREALADMLQQPKRWELLAAACALSALGVTLTLVRWCYLVRGLGLSLPMRNALRIGYLGYLFNLAPMGIVGGDFLKAVMLARQHPGSQAKAVASVIVDRLVGLYVLFLVASAAILLTRFWNLPIPETRIISQAVLAVTAVATLGVAVVLLPGVTNGRLSHVVARIPRIGPALHGVLEAVRMYRRDLPLLGLAAALTVGVHCTFTLSIYMVARGLPGDMLSLATHFVIYPISSVASTLPLPAGPFEGTLVFLYTRVREANLVIPEGQALVVALVFRLISILLAAIGFCYYLGSRHEVARVMHETENEAVTAARENDEVAWPDAETAAVP